MALRRVLPRLVPVLVWLGLLALSSLTFAQGEVTPITIGQNSTGTLTAQASSATYAVTATSGQTATVQVLALSPGFVPRFRVLNPAGVDILVVPNPNSLTSLSASVSFADAGTYTIEISGENGSLGQFVLSLQPGPPLPQAVNLLVNQPVSDTVGSQTPLRLYRFSTTAADDLTLTILAQSADAAPLVSLIDEGAGQTIASSDAELSGVAYRLPPQDRSYRVEVRANGSASAAAFTLCLGTCGGDLLAAEATATPEVVAVTATEAAPAAGCTVVSGTGGSVNVRSGPGTIYAILGSLTGVQAALMLGQSAGGGWYEVSLNGQSGWVAASVTRLAGDCAALVTAAAPSNAPLAPTQRPASGGGAAPTSAPTTRASSGGGAPQAPTDVPTTAPTAAPAVSLPDLIVTISQASYDSAGDVLFVDYTITNIGTAPAFQVDLDACADSDCTGSAIEADVLRPQQSHTGKVGIVHNKDSHRLTTRVTLTVDADNYTVESNEDNNSASLVISNL